MPQSGPFALPKPGTPINLIASFRERSVLHSGFAAVQDDIMLSV
jgi:hypothetical protein